MIAVLIAFAVAFVLLAGVGLLTRAVCRALDKGRRVPERDEATWYTVWRQG